MCLVMVMSFFPHSRLGCVIVSIIKAFIPGVIIWLENGEEGSNSRTQGAGEG